MPTQTDVQKLIQGLAPSGVNTGNPNTVYNTPGTVMGGTPAAPQVQQPNTLTTLATLPQVTPASQLGAWVAPHPTPELNLPQWSMMPFAGTGAAPGGTPTPGTGGGGQPPPTGTTPTPGGQRPGGGHAGAGAFSDTGMWTPGPLSGNIFGQDSIFNHPFSLSDPQIVDTIGIGSIAPAVREQITNENGEIDEDKTESFFSKILPKTPDGEIDWLEALDRITEIVPLLSGVNWHDADTGKINLVSGVIQTVANALGLGPLVRLFSKLLKKGQDSKVERAGRGGCVTVDSYIHGFGRAGDVRVFDTLKVIDPITFELSDAVVSYSEAKLQPTVRIVTKGGTVLECSTSAPICDETGEQVLAENLLGVSIPVSKHGMIEFEVVMEVEDIGEQLVQHITCENNYFLAGEKKGSYLLHHNIKKVDNPRPSRDRTAASLWGPTSFTTEGTYYGTVGPVEQVD